MPVPDSHLKPISFASGVNNRFPETKLGGFSREAVNLDMVDGVPTSRLGRVKRVDTAAPHSLWTHELLDFALFVSGDTLYALHPDYDVTVVRAGLQAREVSYAYAAGRVYWSNGVDTGCVWADASAHTWGVETPTDTASLSVSFTGGLPGGQYQVALTYMTGAREESGAPPSMFVDVPDGAGIIISSIPAPSSSDVTAVRVYISGAGDPRLFHVRDVAVGMATVTIGAGARGRLLDTQFLAPTTPGRHHLLKNGRIFYASVKLLRWTEALRYGLTDPEHNYVKLPDSVTCICAPDTDGTVIYVGTKKKTYRFRGDDINAATLVSAGHVGIVPGSMVMVPHEQLELEGVLHDTPVWLGTNGSFYAGTDQGVMLLNKFAAAKVYDTAAVTVSERGYVTVAGRGGKQSGLAFSDRMVARVVDIG